MVVFGSLGIGFVWGWLLGLVIARRPRPFPRIAYLTIALPLFIVTLFGAYTIYALLDINQTIFFMGATAVAALFHHAVMEGLRARSQQPRPTSG